MNVVIIPSDGFVSVNGRSFSGLDLSWIAPEVHAVNWIDVAGEVQIVDPITHMAVRNEEITDLATFQMALDQWEAARVIADTPPSLPERRATRWEQAKAERSRREYGGVQAAGHWFQTDPESQLKLMRLDMKADAVLASGGAATDVLTILGQPVGWKTYDNGVVPMTAGLAKEIATAIEAQSALSYARGQALYAQIMTSEDPEAIDITTGWPPTYGG